MRALSVLSLLTLLDKVYMHVLSVISTYIFLTKCTCMCYHCYLYLHFLDKVYMRALSLLSLLVFPFNKTVL